VLGNIKSFSRFRAATPICPRAEKAQPDNKAKQTMRLLALLTLAVSLMLVGCEKQAETPAPSTNAPAKP
jgi:hypothetical protein